MILLTYAGVFLTVLALWVGRTYWVAIGIAAVALGYLGGVLYGPAVVWIVLCAGACALYARSRARDDRPRRPWLLVFSAACIVAMSLALGMHALPGFRNYLVAKEVLLSPGALPYTLYLNIDKTIAGVMILGIVYASLLKRGGQWLEALRMAAPIAAVTIIVVILLSLGAGYVEWAPKWTSFFWIWAASNLLLTCMAEEAFFRGFLQRELALRLAHQRWAAALSVSVSALTFGLAHFAGGLAYVALASVAGLGYALVYHRTRSIEMSMLTHFALNATHFLLFTYPRTA